MAKEIAFTQAWVDKLKPGAARATYRDAKTDGLVLVVQPSGKKTFGWYRKRFGRATWKNIGHVPDFDVQEARAKALEWNANLAQGKDPFVQTGDATLGEAFQRYSDEHLAEHSKNPTRSVADSKQIFDAQFSAWKDRKLPTITDADVAQRQREIRKKHSTYVSNRAMQLLRAVINFAIKKKIWPVAPEANPVRGIALYAETERDRFIQPDEMPRIWAQLDQEGNLNLRDFIILALTTGARRGDVLSMRWTDIRQDATGAKFWTIPDPKNRRPYNIPLLEDALVVLEGRHKRNRKSDWVFPTKTGKNKNIGHIASLKKSWIRFRKQVKCPDLRIHDLRRTLGSWQAGQGSSLSIIGKSLGHSSTAATEIYAKLNLDPVRASIQGAVTAMRALPPPTE